MRAERSREVCERYGLATALISARAPISPTTARLITEADLTRGTPARPSMLSSSSSSSSDSMVTQLAPPSSSPHSPTRGRQCLRFTIAMPRPELCSAELEGAALLLQHPVGSGEEAEAQRVAEAESAMDKETKKNGEPARVPGQLPTLAAAAAAAAATASPSPTPSSATSSGEKENRPFKRRKISNKKGVAKAVKTRRGTAANSL